jgi:hypothetical protein
MHRGMVPPQQRPCKRMTMTGSPLSLSIAVAEFTVEGRAVLPRVVQLESQPGSRATSTR